MVLLDTSFLLDLEAGDASTTQAYERLRGSYTLDYLPICSHELVKLGLMGDIIARAFLIKEDIYKITRVNLTGIQLDCAKKGAEAIEESGLIEDDNARQVVGEAATIPGVNFYVSDYKQFTPSVMTKVNRLIEPFGDPVTFVKMSKVLRSF
jgi:hypothetical protein